ncbi:IrrE N-terminal-like domain-containing protein [Tumidithrix helvetica PCC 7403]|uniref:ImmA/IrrE family metallo-endopeptidase n=1 Tax=Tumidithrix helvetica TaxID=3457545 RepID=UPI003CBCCEAA
MNIIKPFLWARKEDIERKANEILRELQAHPKHSFNGRIDPNKIADFLDLGIVWGSIPSDSKGKIAARIFPLERLIEINEDIPSLKEESGFASFTIAHEIGHWSLHINQAEADGLIKQQELDIEMPRESQPFLCRSLNRNTGADIEWQADYFAGSLLMPRYLLEETRKGRNLQKLSHLRAMKDELGVSLAALKVRLQQMEWICIPKNSQQIYLGKYISTEQGELF